MANRGDNQEQWAGAGGFGRETPEGWHPADIVERDPHGTRIDVTGVEFV